MVQVGKPVNLTMAILSVSSVLALTNMEIQFFNWTGACLIVVAIVYHLSLVHVIHCGHFMGPQE
ncbi:MAG: hypothetical protein CME32_18765 [Gimesia sp.]|nr:hypothetical protein [Gimesia sp.]